MLFKRMAASISSGGLASSGKRALGTVPLPNVTLHTQYGQLPNLLRDTAICLTQDLAPLFSARHAHFWDHDDMISRSGKSLKEYCSMSDRVAVLTLRDPSDVDEKYDSTEASVTISATAGMRPVSLAAYCQQIARMRPDVAVLMHDDVPQNAGKRRRRNAMDRTLQWINDCRLALDLAFIEEEKKSAGAPLARPLVFAAVPAVPDPVARKKLLDGIAAAFAANAASKTPLSGLFFTPSFWDHDGGLDVELLRTTAASLPALAEVPRMLSAPLNPLEALEAIVEHGVDVIDSDYASTLAFAGYALTFDLEPPAASASSVEGAGAMPIDGAPDAAAPSAAAPAVIDLGNAAFYKRDAAPLKAGCPCFACNGTTAEQVSSTLLPAGLAAGGAHASVVHAAQPIVRTHPGHTRAYIHHLTDCGEILGRSLLSAHNSVHVARFLQTIRRKQAEGGEQALREYRDWFRSAYGAPSVAADEAPAATSTGAAAEKPGDAEEAAPKRKNTLPSTFPSLRAVQAAAKASAGREGFDKDEDGVAGGPKQPAAKRPAK